jgi:predicted acylesterase/phospholipase RssA
MRRAIVLNSGLSWGAYQVGALRFLMGDRKMHFDLCAGTGLGALNAALVACNEYEALQLLWQALPLFKWTAIHWRGLWREGFLAKTPAQNFINAHVKEERLVELGTQIVFNCLDVSTGREQVFEYPGSMTPLTDALAAAVGTAGVNPSLRIGEQHLVEATLINSFLLPLIVHRPVDEIWVVVAALPPSDPTRPPKQIRTWRAVAQRGLQMNQTQDVRNGLAFAEKLIAAAEAFRGMSNTLPQQLAAQITDPERAVRLRNELTKVYDRSTSPFRSSEKPTIYLIAPSQDLDYPMWRFRPRDLESAITLGYADAKKAACQTGIDA